MTHFLDIDQHGLLHSKFVGKIDEEAIDEFINNVEPFLARATPETPLHFVADASEEGKWTFNARRHFTDLFDSNERMGAVAVVNASRYIRVISTFMVKATGKEDEVRFFSRKEEALAWLLTFKQPV